MKLLRELSGNLGVVGNSLVHVHDLGLTVDLSYYYTQVEKLLIIENYFHRITQLLNMNNNSGGNPKGKRGQGKNITLGSELEQPLMSGFD